ATARPMPEFAPVTRAFCPIKLLGIDRDVGVETMTFSPLQSADRSVGHSGLAMSWAGGRSRRDFAHAAAAILIAIVWVGYVWMICPRTDRPMPASIASVISLIISPAWAAT